MHGAFAVWRGTRAEAIADIVDRITTQLSRGWEPPAPRLHRTFQVASVAASADDVHHCRAARTILGNLPISIR